MEKRESRLLRFSKHTFTQPQHIGLNSLRIGLGLPYRGFVDMPKEMPRIGEVLGLKEIPHYTTLQAVWRVLLRASTSLPRPPWWMWGTR